MGVFSRPDSKYWWLWLETAPKGQQKVRTDVLIGRDQSASRKLAEQVYYREMGLLASASHGLPQARQVITFDAFATWYDQHAIEHHRGKVREREILKVLRAAFGPLDLKAIDRPRVLEWRTTRATQVSANTTNRELDVLKQILAAAVPKYLAASPIAGLRRLPVVPPQRRLLSPSEEKRLLDAATDPQDRALLILGLDTLLRLGDLLNLRRTDRKGSWLYVRHPKGGKPYEVPLSPRAAAALSRIRPGVCSPVVRSKAAPTEQPANKPSGVVSRSEFFFTKFRQAKNPRDWRSAVRQRFAWLCEQADPPVPFGKAAGGVTWHWMTRRTGATRLLVAKQTPIPVVQRIGNWRTPDVLLEIYAEAQRDDLLAAVGSLPRRSRKAGGSL